MFFVFSAIFTPILTTRFRTTYQAVFDKNVEYQKWDLG